MLYAKGIYVIEKYHHHVGTISSNFWKLEQHVATRKTVFGKNQFIVRNTFDQS